MRNAHEILAMVVLALATIVTTPAARAAKGGAWRIEGILVEQAWARVQPGAMRNGSIYLTLHNISLTDDLLLAVDSKAARTTSVHKTQISNGVARMTPMPFGVDLRAGTEVILQPGSMHIMLTELSSDIKPGGTLRITMVFREAGTLSADIPVLAQSDASPDISHGGHTP